MPESPVSVRLLCILSFRDPGRWLTVTEAVANMVGTTQLRPDHQGDITCLSLDIFS